MRALWRWYRHPWRTYRGWPRWAQIVAAVIVVLAIIGIVTATPKKKAAAPKAKTPTTKIPAPVLPTTVPASVANQIHALAGQDAYLPTFLPPGYRYVSWKKELANGRTHTDQPWFEVDFKKGAAKLAWDVAVWSKIVCGTSAIGGEAGSATFGGQTGYWGATAAEINKKSGIVGGPNGRNFWSCETSTGGDDLLVFVYSNSPTLPPPPVGAHMAASAKLA